MIKLELESFRDSASQLYANDGRLRPTTIGSLCVLCDKAVSYVQFGLGHGKVFKLYEQDYTRLYIVFVSRLKVMLCFNGPVGSQFILEKENNDCKQTVIVIVVTGQVLSLSLTFTEKSSS